MARFDSMNLQCRSAIGSRFRLRMEPYFRACGFTLLLAAAFAILLSNSANAKSRYNKNYFSNSQVLDHTGRKYQFFDDLIAGKVVVINFVYLTCNDICPLTTSRMAELAGRLGDLLGRDVFIYSITMDPERDRPAELAAYAAAFAAPKGWLFLTGEPDEIKKLRWRLGERSRNLAEHRNDVVLGNDVTGEWSRSSIYADIEVLERNVKDLAGLERLDERRSRIASKDPAAPQNRDRYRFDRPSGEALFIKACSTCHSIGGGDIVGPDLKDISERRSRDWLDRFIADPRAMRRSGDATALAISEKYKGVIMPDLGLGPADIEDVLSYIALRSKMPKDSTGRQAGEERRAERQSGR